MGSIPTRSRHLLLALGLLLGAFRSGVAQDSVVAVPRPMLVPIVDTISPLAKPVKSATAFFMSFAIPGWGQARLDRKLTGAIFGTIEGLSIAMTVKTIRELKYLSRIEADTARIASKRTQRQDWLILLGFNHLFAGLEAFVATELHEFPVDVRFRVLPGGFGTELAIPFRIR
ncbi:MAG: hypothetical protein ACKVZ0_00330 [Gemmatimonadales bacterium]